jgi:uncharacterized membrane protein
MQKFVLLLILILFIASNVIGDYQQRKYNEQYKVSVTPVKNSVYTFVSFTDHKD